MMAETTTDEKKKSPVRMILLTGGILVAEAVVIIAAMMFIGGPAEVRSEPLADMEQPEDEKIVEILVLDSRLANDKRGITFVYDTEIYVQVKKKFEEMVNSQLEQFRNEIRSNITAIWRTAEPEQLSESNLQTLTRQIEALLRDRFEIDPDAEESIVRKCVIISGTGYRVQG